MYKFHSGEELIKLAKQHKIPISEVVIRYETANSTRNRSQVIEKMYKRLEYMDKAIQDGLKNKKPSASGMSGESTYKLLKIMKNKKKKMLLNDLTLKAMTYALATVENNATMGCIVASPTAGASGVIPGVLFAVKEYLKLSKEELLKGIFVTSGVGLIIAENATLAGAEGGCQAEIGSATAMAAAGITEMRGGQPDDCLNAAALALKNLLGLTCDPIGGMVEVPCVKRNALAAVYSIAASDMTMVGIESFVPFDEVVEAMSNIGKLISPKLRETALGGLAVTDTGKKLNKKLGLKIKSND